MSLHRSPTDSEEILTTELERVRSLLRRYLSPRVADAVLEERHAPHGPGQVSVVSVLLCDLRGFTAYAQHASPIDVARSLNAFLEEMTQVVFKYDGVLDKYTGDGLIAVFGVPYQQPDHAQRAVHAALEMQARYEQIRDHWSGAAKIPEGLGIGIQSGEVLAGNFGSLQRVDYTVIGHPVNLAARLTAAAAAGHILLGEATRELVHELVEVEHLGTISYKNVTEPIPTYRLLGLHPEASSFCLQCGAHIEEGMRICPVCRSNLDLYRRQNSEVHNLFTVARIASTLTNSNSSPGPHCIAVAGPHQGADFGVRLPCTMGREALTNQIVLSLDPSVSRRHAVLKMDNSDAVVADLASQNGTYLNGVQIDIAAIQDGDILTLGRTRLVVSGLRDHQQRPPT